MSTEQERELARQFPREMLQDLVDGPFQQFDIVEAPHPTEGTVRAMVLEAGPESCVIGIPDGGTPRVLNDWLTYVGVSAVGLLVREMHGR